MKVFSKNSHFFPLVGLLLLVSSALLISKFGKMGQALMTVDEGINTCFQRVSQSYTARLINDFQSVYLDKNFTKMTEECFGESLGLLEEVDVADGGKALKTLNVLSNDVHWFHQKLETPLKSGFVDVVPQKVMTNYLSRRFEKLELKKDSIIERIDNRRAYVKRLSGKVHFIFLLAAFFVPIFIVFDFLMKRAIVRERLEAEASAEAQMKAEIYKPEAVEVLIKRTLEGAGFYQLARLFDAYRSRRSASNFVEPDPLKRAGVQDEAGVSHLVVEGPREEKLAQIDRIWKESENSKRLVVSLNKEKSALRDVVEIESLLSSVVDLVSSKILTSGIQFDVHSIKISVYAHYKSLEQAFCRILMNFIEACDIDNPHKSISIKMRALGEVLLIDFFGTGEGFDQSVIERKELSSTRRLEHSTEKDIESVNLELSVLIKDFGGNIAFENMTNEDGQPVGKKVQVSLKMAPAKLSLVDVQKVAGASSVQGARR